jgi:demethylmenaquinone methyltransferase/2-methoxy-6-polyprenyl-1,4-benzoquinol methylase
LANLTGTERERYVRAMFTQIAFRYDFMNRLMTAGQDVRWRKEVIQRAALPRNGSLLDLGAGTGDLSREALRQYPESRVVAADFTLEMMRVGRSREDKQTSKNPGFSWSSADALNLPFPESTFDATVSGFLLRNVSDVKRCFSEQYRVLRPGGKIVVLDTTPPLDTWMTPLIYFYLDNMIPLLGSLLTGQGEAYTYLPNSTENFLEPERLVTRMQAAGFHNVAFRRLMFGTVAIHWGQK